MIKCINNTVEIIIIPINNHLDLIFFNERKTTRKKIAGIRPPIHPYLKKTFWIVLKVVLKFSKSYINQEVRSIDTVKKILKK